MIATPIVLGIINDARVNAQKSTIKNIIHAAELYYSKSQMTGKELDTITFDLSDKNNGLEYDGQRPSGMLTIYSNGQTYLNVKFDDGSAYMKKPEEEEIIEGNQVIGSSEIWETQNGKLTDYKGSVALGSAELATKNFAMYLVVAFEYGTSDRTDSNGNALPMFEKNLSELIKEMENNGELSRKNLPDVLNKEINIIIEIFDVDHQLTQEEQDALIPNYQTQLPYAIDIFMNMSNHGENWQSYKAYQLISKTVKNEKQFLIIPNYVEHEDGTLEEIKTIGKNVFYKNANSSHSCNITSADGVNVIISEGIEKIEESGFYLCFIDSITFANSIKTIGQVAFGFNRIGQTILPASLETIGRSAFNGSGIRGSLIIPSNVKTIGTYAFQSVAESEVDCNTLKPEEYNTCILLKGMSTKITSLTFAKNSKIETIDNTAFEEHPITELVIPGSIKTIGSNAFNTTTLKSVIIERAQGDDLSIGENAFGSATIEYRP